MRIKKRNADGFAGTVSIMFFCLFAVQSTIKAQEVSTSLLERLTEPPILAGSHYHDYFRYNNFLESYVSRFIHSRVAELSRKNDFEYQWGDKSEYMPHSFSLKYKTPEYPDIYFISSHQTKRRVLPLRERLLHYQTISYGGRAVTGQKPIDVAIRNTVFGSPALVQYVWNDIPDVSDVGTTKLDRKAADQPILSLLSHADTFNTRPNLMQIIIPKSPWTFKGTENIQLSQGYLENWAKGGESSVALSSDLRLNANFKKGKHSWENYIIHKVGVLSTAEEKRRINDDLIELNTKYGLQSSKKWYYSFLYNFKTQFFNGYASADTDHETPISGFFAPAYMSFALGMDYKPSNKFTLMLSPFTSRLTIVADTSKIDQTRYGIDADRRVKELHGFSVVNSFNYQLSKEIGVASKLDMFYEYLNSSSDKQVQADWEFIVDMRINQFLSTRLLANLRYFTNESDKLQVRENFNIAFKYNF